MLRLEEIADIREFVKKQVDEMEENTTANVGEFETPNAFTGDDSDDGTQTVDLTDPEYAYSIKGPKKRNPKYSVKLNEASYQTFKKDESRSTVQKVNTNILEVNKKLYELARMLQHSIKLKTEQKLDNNIHWKKTNEALAKMHNRLSVLSEKANSLYNLTEATAQQAEKDMLALLNSVGVIAFKQLGPNDIEANTVGADHFEFDIMLNGEPLAIDWEKGNLVYQSYNKSIPLGNINEPEEVVANIKKHII